MTNRRATYILTVGSLLFWFGGLGVVHWLIVR